MRAREGDEMIPTAEPVRLVLELAPDREPLEGSVWLGPTETRAFTGWMELVAAVESAIATAGIGPHGGRTGVGTGKED